MSKRRIPVRVIHTQKDGYSVELFVQAKELNANLPASQMMRHENGIWKQLHSFGHNFKKAWDYRNAELKSLGWL